MNGVNGVADTAAEVDLATIVLDALMCATPEPPPVTTDPSEVIALAEQMAAARGLILDDLTARGISDLPPGPYLARARELADRDARWTAALNRAKHQLGQRMTSVSRLGRSRY